jgi:hypothetical protein
MTARELATKIAEFLNALPDEDGEPGESMNATVRGSSSRELACLQARDTVHCYDFEIIIVQR